MTSDVTLDVAVRQDGPSTMLCNENGWWEEERARLIRDRVDELTRPGALIADIGCGRGRLLAHPALVGRTIVNVDSHVWDEWQERDDDVLFVCASADALPFRSGAFDLVGSFDVLEHIADDQAGLIEQRRIVGDDGTVVCAVPADPRLWSGHDVAAGHFRRYDMDTLAELASRCGLDVERSTYFFAFLWLPAWLTRKQSVRSEPGNGQGALGALVRRAVGAVSAVERALLRRRRLPFGTSLWAEARPSLRLAASRGDDRPPAHLHRATTRRTRSRRDV